LQEVIVEAGQDEALPPVDSISVMLDKDRVLEMRNKAAAVKANEPGRTVYGDRCFKEVKGFVRSHSHYHAA
jgi:hypothetical protein